MKKIIAKTTHGKGKIDLTSKVKDVFLQVDLDPESSLFQLIIFYINLKVHYINLFILREKMMKLLREVQDLIKKEIPK